MPSNDASVMQCNNGSMIPSNNASVMPYNNASVMPYNNASVMPCNNGSMIPSNNASIIPSNNASMIPSNHASVMPYKKVQSDILVQNMVLASSSCLNTALVNAKVIVPQKGAFMVVKIGENYVALSYESIRKNAVNGSVFSEGIDLYAVEMIKRLVYLAEDNSFSALISDEVTYAVKLVFTKSGELATMHCDCSLFYENRKACRHIAATMVALLQFFGGKSTLRVENIFRFVDVEKENNAEQMEGSRGNTSDRQSRTNGEPFPLSQGQHSAFDDLRPNNKPRTDGSASLKNEPSVPLQPIHYPHPDVSNNFRTDKKSSANKDDLNKNTRDFIDLFSGLSSLLAPKADNPKAKAVVNGALIKLQPVCTFRFVGPSAVCELELEVVENQRTLVKDLTQLIHAYKNRQQMILSKYSTYDPERRPFDEKSQQLMQLLSKIHTDSQKTYRASAMVNPIFGNKKSALLSDFHMAAFLRIYLGSDIVIRKSNNPRTFVPVVAYEADLLGDIVPSFEVKPEYGGIRLVSTTLRPVRLLDSEGEFLYDEKRIIHTNKVFRENILPVIRQCASGSMNLFFPENRVPELFTSILPTMQRHFQVSREPAVSDLYHYEPLIAVVYFDLETDKTPQAISARVVFQNCDRTISPFDSDFTEQSNITQNNMNQADMNKSNMNKSNMNQRNSSQSNIRQSAANLSSMDQNDTVHGDADQCSENQHSITQSSFMPGTSPNIDGKTLIRAVREEEEILQYLESAGFEAEEDLYLLSEDTLIFDFVSGDLAELQALATLYYSESFKKLSVSATVDFQAHMRLSTDSMLDFTLDLSGIEADEIARFWAALRRKKKFFRLKNGDFIPFQEDKYEDMLELLDECCSSDVDVDDNVYHLPAYKALMLEERLAEQPDVDVQKNEALKQLVQNMAEPEKTDFLLPTELEPVLRDYQKTGFRWLKTLARYGFGGILADDMGLGKTLEVIAFLLSEKQEKVGTPEYRPAIVVAPTSLVYNWKEEVAKFTDKLTVKIVSGPVTERVQQIHKRDNADLWVTTYGMMKRDIAHYKDKTFSYCILDEAQHIKNARTLNAKTVKMLKARSYFALTGTPIENSLMDLWSAFDFIMPGFLRSQQQFSRKYEFPMINGLDLKVLKELGKQTKPFILRRMKRDVLKELPEKTETRLICEMQHEQKVVYLAHLEKARAELFVGIEKNGFERSKMMILALLTRLRQICCHPALFVDPYHGRSAKMEMLKEILAEAFDGGHRVLLFSQFTGMLSIIQEELQKQGIPYFYLDGATKSEDRMTMVKSFNGGENSIFLISLKAGGTGLNLTGADIVIHFDPWWNPAVEDQATDRAYRIGQKNPVQVFRLVCKGTIEEKIFSLQQKKEELVEAVIQPGENLLGKMSREEIQALFEEG